MKACGFPLTLHRSGVPSALVALMWWSIVPRGRVRRVSRFIFFGPLWCLLTAGLFGECIYYSRGSSRVQGFFFSESVGRARPHGAGRGCPPPRLPTGHQSRHQTALPNGPRGP